MLTATPPGGNTQEPRCTKCDEWVRMEFLLGTEYGRQPRKGAVPVLVCPKCRQVATPVPASRALHGGGAQAREVLPPRRFAMCEDVNFEYSGVDWYVLPRLRRSGHEREGHHTPVFFDLRALLKYMVRPEYAMRHFRDGGIIHFANGSDLKYGVTRSGRMVCWLGDLDCIPEQERHYLLSDNLASDHDVASWLYRDLLGLPPAPSAEQELVRAFFCAAEAAHDALGRGLWILGSREIQTLHTMVRPVVWNEYVSYAINNLDKALVDSIDLVFLNARLSDLGIRPEHDNSKISCLAALLKPRAGADGGLDPVHLQTLHTWRNSLDHASLGMQGKEADWRRMRLAPPNRGYERAYDSMLAGLVETFRRTAELMENMATDTAGALPKTKPR